jgi:hypothetical protein
MGLNSWVKIAESKLLLPSFMNCCGYQSAARVFGILLLTHLRQHVAAISFPCPAASLNRPDAAPLFSMLPSKRTRCRWCGRSLRNLSQAAEPKGSESASKLRSLKIPQLLIGESEEIWSDSHSLSPL